MIVLWSLIEKNVFKIRFEKRGILTKIPFLHKAFHGRFWKGMTLFFQEASPLIGNQTCHKTNMFSPHWSNSCFESDYESVCIMVNGKTSSVPLNLLSSVVLNRIYWNFVILFSTVMSSSSSIMVYIPTSLHKLWPFVMKIHSLKRFVLSKLNSFDPNILKLGHIV